MSSWLFKVFFGGGKLNCIKSLACYLSLLDQCERQFTCKIHWKSHFGEWHEGFRFWVSRRYGNISVGGKLAPILVLSTEVGAMNLEVTK